MWSCPRCGARNGRDAEHCAQCGMPSPFHDGGTTKTIDIPQSEADARAEAPRRRVSLPWVAVVGAVVLVLAIVLLAVVVLTG